MDEPKKRGGRPRLEINKEEFEKLCALMCTRQDIAGWFDCTEETIQNWCKRVYRKPFSEVFERYSAKGKISLRRYQFEIAKKNPTMAIWLGKQWLGQTDSVIVSRETNGENDPLTESLKELAEAINADQ